MADNAGLDANIQPEKTLTRGSLSRTSVISRKAADSGGSSGGRLSQVRAVISKPPNRIGSPTGALRVVTRAVTLSRPRRTAIGYGSADAGTLATTEIISEGIKRRIMSAFLTFLAPKTSWFGAYWWIFMPAKPVCGR